MYVLKIRNSDHWVESDPRRARRLARPEADDDPNALVVRVHAVTLGLEGDWWGEVAVLPHEVALDGRETVVKLLTMSTYHRVDILRDGLRVVDPQG